LNTEGSKCGHGKRKRRERDGDIDDVESLTGGSFTSQAEYRV